MGGENRGREEKNGNFAPPTEKSLRLPWQRPLRNRKGGSDQ